MSCKAHRAAARRHSVMPPASEASKFTMSTAPLAISRRTPCAGGLALAGIDRDRGARGAPPPSSAHHHTSGTAPRTRRCRTARSGAQSGWPRQTGQPRLASTAIMKSSPAPSRAASTRSASFSGDKPPTLTLQPAMPASLQALHLLAEIGQGLALLIVAADAR